MPKIQRVPGSRCMDEDNFRPAKKINIFINGDKHNTARQLTLPKRVEATKEPQAMQGLFTMLTKKLQDKMQFRDAIHHLLTPYGGTRVTSVKGLKNDHDYVACNKNKLIRIDYEHVGKSDTIPKSTRTVHTTWSQLRADPQIYAAPIKHCNQYAKQYIHNIREITTHYGDSKPRKVIYIYGNGDPVSSTKILLRGKLAGNDKDTFLLVLDYISTRVGQTLASTRSAMAARKLYTLKWKRIKKSSQIEEGQAYIVCGDQKLKRVPYGKVEEVQPAWKGAIKPPRTNDGRIKMIEMTSSEHHAKTTKVPTIQLPKLTKKKIEYSEKFMSSMGRSPIPNSPIPPTISPSQKSRSSMKSNRMSSD